MPRRRQGLSEAPLQYVTGLVPKFRLTYTPELVLKIAEVAVPSGRSEKPIKLADKDLTALRHHLATNAARFHSLQSEDRIGPSLYRRKLKSIKNATERLLELIGAERSYETSQSNRDWARALSSASVELRNRCQSTFGSRNRFDLGGIVNFQTMLNAAILICRDVARDQITMGTDSASQPAQGRMPYKFAATDYIENMMLTYMHFFKRRPGTSTRSGKKGPYGPLVRFIQEAARVGDIRLTPGGIRSGVERSQMRKSLQPKA